MGLHELTYCSLATRAMSPADLTALLDEAREKNLQRGITGLLVFFRQEFIQLLEGDRAEIFSLYQSICSDPRNRNNHLMWEEPITQRSFADWSMAFTAMDDLTPKDRLGFSDFLDVGFDAMAHSGSASMGKKFLRLHRTAFLRQQAQPGGAR